MNSTRATSVIKAHSWWMAGWLLLNAFQTSYAADTDATSPEQVEEVLVTATKRVEPLQRVPEAVSAISGDSLEQMGATSFVDYARTVPSLSFYDLGAGRERPFLRGVNPSAGSDTVGYYVGDTPVESIGGSPINPTLVDLDHIEVLRGPQGTLYGGESIGGTIKLVPVAPNLNKIEGEVSSTGQITQGDGRWGPGGYGDGVINLPIVEDHAAFRAAVWGRDVDGFIDRKFGSVGNFGDAAHPVGVEHNVPHEHTWGVRTTLLVKPVEKLDITAMAFIQDQRFDGFTDITGGDGNPNNHLVQDFISNTAELQRNKFSLYSLTAAYDAGPVNLVSNTGYSTYILNINEEATSALALIFPNNTSQFPTTAGQFNKSYTFTQENRIATTDTIYGFDAVLGIYYEQNRNSQHFRWAPPEFNSVFAGNDASNPLYAINNNLFSGDGTGFLRQTAEFGEITYHLTNDVKLTGGLRHYVLSNGFANLTGGIFSAAPPGGYHYNETLSAASGWVHKGNLSYQITDDHMVYAQYSEGFRPGFGNGSLPSNCNAGEAPAQVNPDSIKNYEIGGKSSWFDKRLTINGALYRIDWSDIQQSALLACGFGFGANFGDARIKGAEIEVSDRLTNYLSVGLSGSYTKAQLQQDGTPPVTSGAKAGDQIEGVPVWQYSLYSTLSYPILNGIDGYTRVDYQYTGSSFSNYARLADETRDPSVEVQVTRFLNFRTGFKIGNWDCSISGNNMLNNVERQSLDPNAQITFSIPGRPRYVVTRPRTLALNVNYKF